MIHQATEKPEELPERSAAHSLYPHQVSKNTQWKTCLFTMSKVYVQHKTRLFI